MTPDEIKDKINEFDRFCKHNGMRLTVVRPGYAEAEMDVNPEKLNGFGMVQGGAIFTLADLAFSGASNSAGIPTVSLAANFTFLRPGDGSRIKAVAQELHRGRSTGLYELKVYNDRDKLIAFGTGNGFAVNETFR